MIKGSAIQPRTQIFTSHFLHSGVRVSVSASAPTGGTSLDPEQKARHVRPLGWKAPGPPPSGNQGKKELQPLPGEDLSYLTGDWRIFQLKDGHRWSLDDMVTAFVALQQAQLASNAGAPVRLAMDLGCGIGSVLLMVAWGLPTARLLGVEAQPTSADMARRSLVYNGCEGRIDLRQGDFRDPAVLPPGATPADLITGTPPYLPLSSGPASSRPQKEPCCFETRGGIEDYCVAAASHLASDGQFVVCSGVQGQPAGRTDRAAEAAGLAVLRRLTVVPREGKPPLLTVHVMARPASAPVARCCGTADELFVVRLKDGRLSEDMHAAREAMGLPPLRRPAGL